MRQSSTRTFGSTAAAVERHILLAFVGLMLLTTHRGGATSYSFLVVDTGIEDTTSDEHLRTYLQRNTRVELNPPDKRDYKPAIDALVAASAANEPLLARTSPYVLVVAQLMGTPLIPIATYESSAGGARIYHAFLVVNRKSIDAFRHVENKEPTLSEVISFLRGTSHPLFIFKDEFSTSGYFVPISYLRSNEIFAASKYGPFDPEALTSDQRKKTSEELIAAVANGEAMQGSAPPTLTAAWEGDLLKVPREVLAKTYSVKLPGDLPNDLLVCNSAFPPRDAEAIRNAIRAMPANWIKQRQPKATIADWKDILDAPEAATALNELRQMAVHPQRRSVVHVSGDAPAEVMSAVERAIARSHREFVKYDQAAHSRIDYEWTVELTPDKALALNSTLAGMLTQSTVIPFHGSQDLTRRVRIWMDTELAIVRYVWPYQRASTVVLRDFDYPVQQDTSLMAQTITWSDIARNNFRVNSEVDLKLKVQKAGDDLLTLVDAATRGSDNVGIDRGAQLDFDPLSRDAIRVLIDRRAQTSTFLSSMSFFGGALLLLVGALAMIDLRRKTLPTVSAVTITPVQLAHSAVVDRYYRPWRERVLVRTDIVYCDRSALEEEITDLCMRGLRLNEVETSIREVGIFSDIPVVKWILRLGGGRKWTQESDPAKVSDEVRLTKVLNATVRQQRLMAEFIGSEDVTAELRPIVAEVLGTPTAVHPDLIMKIDELNGAHEEILNTLAAYQTFAALTMSEAKLHLVTAPWLVSASKDSIELSHTIAWKNVRWAVQPRERPRSLLLRFTLPTSAKDRVTDEGVTAWLLGKVGQITASECRIVIEYDCLALVH
jgi:ABC-type phosphate/phosphonate transport system substrate-binding protein